MNRVNPYQLHTPDELALELADKLRRLRLARNWKQTTLAKRAGVSLGSLRRFEQTGQISLKHLLELSFVLERLDDFKELLVPASAQSIAELEKMSSPPKVQRGRK